MPSLAGLIATLDRDSDRIQKISFFQLSSADPVAVAAILQALFQANNGTTISGSSQATSALLQRARQQSTSSGANTANTFRGQQQGARGQ